MRRAQLVEGKPSEAGEAADRQQRAAQRVLPLQFDQAVQHRERGDRGEEEAGPVEGLGRREEGRHHGQVATRELQRHEAEGHHHEEDRTPAELLHQDAADGRPDGRREHHAKAEDADRAPLPVGRELAHDHHVRNRGEDPRRNALQHPHADHHRVVAGEAADDATRHQQERRADVGLAQAVALQQPGREQQREGRRGHEGRGDPLRAVLPDMEIPAHVRHGHVDDGRGHDRGHHPHHDREQHQPPEAGPVALSKLLYGGRGGGLHAGSSMGPAPGDLGTVSRTKRIMAPFRDLPARR